MRDDACMTVREALSRGEAPPREHLERCEPCAELAKDGGALAQWLAGPEGDGEAPESLWARVGADLERETGFRAWLRSRPTSIRILLGFAVVVATALAVVFKSGLSVDASARPIIAFTSLFVLAAGALAVGLRPAQRPALPPTTVSMITATLLLILLGLTLLPMVRGETGADTFQTAMPCLSLGVLFGVPTYAAVRLLDRGLQKTLNQLLAAIAAGVAGNIGLSLSCPMQTPKHLLGGHFSVGIVFVAASLALVVLGRTLSTPKGEHAA